MSNTREIDVKNTASLIFSLLKSFAISVFSIKHSQFLFARKQIIDFNGSVCQLTLRQRFAFVCKMTVNSPASASGARFPVCILPENTDFSSRALINIYTNKKKCVIIN